MIIACGTGDSSSPTRVVFQAVLGRLDTGCLGSFRVNRFFFLSFLHLGLWFSACSTSVSMHGYPIIFVRLMLAVTSVMIAFVWVMVLCALSREFRKSRWTDQVRTTDRLSTALVLELCAKLAAAEVGTARARFHRCGRPAARLRGISRSRSDARFGMAEEAVAPFASVRPAAEAAVHSSSSVLRIAALRWSGSNLARAAAESLWIPNRSDDWASLAAPGRSTCSGKRNRSP